MDTFIGRAQTGFGKFSTAVSVGAFIIALLGVCQLWVDGAFGLSSAVGNVTPTMRWHDSWRYGATHNQRKENARFKFDLDADLTPLFNWNTKQVFVYLTAEYNTTSRKTGTENSNSVVIWDKIVKSKDDAHLKLRSQAGKYSVYDIQQVFGGDNREVQLSFQWNVQPHVGLLVYGETAIEGGTIELPPLPQKKNKAESD